MKQIVMFLGFSLVLAAMCHAPTARAADRDQTPESGAIHHVALLDAAGFRQIHRVVVFLSGADANDARLLEDALATELQNRSFEVVTRSELQEAVASDFLELTRAAADSTRRAPTPARNELAIAKLVHADAFVSGVFQTGRLQMTNQQVKSTWTADKFVVTAATAQVVEVQGNRTLVSVSVGFQYGDGFVHAAQDIAETLEAQRNAGAKR